MWMQRLALSVIFILMTAGCAGRSYNPRPMAEVPFKDRAQTQSENGVRVTVAVLSAEECKEVFGLEDINELPISYDIAWYEQKAVAVLLALLFVGVKGIRLGPTLPAFLSPTVAKVLVENFDIKPTGTVKEDIEAMMKGA